MYWQNYNKSRIHSSRGARYIEITLDGVPIFVGEIARASGGVVGTSECFGDVRVEYWFLRAKNSNITDRQSDQLICML